MAGRLRRAIAVREYAGAWVVLGLAALFGLQVGDFTRRNWRPSYSFDHIPGKLLP